MRHATHPSKRKVAGLLAGTLAALTLVGAGAVSAADALEPAEIEFKSSYGDMSFPEQYPDGTEISITQWSHFVPRYDEWFDEYAQKWGEAHNVKVTVNHINLGDIPSTLAAAIAAGEGPTLMEMNAGSAAFIDGLANLDDVNEAAAEAFGERAETCRHMSYLPSMDTWYGFCHGWVVDPGVYRTDLWEEAGYAEGPETYADLLEGGSKIFQQTGAPVGVGMSPELDSEFFTRALIWSFGGSIQDESGNVVFDSPETLAAVKYMKELFGSAMTPEVFAWNPASNNQLYIAGDASYIQNSISFFRSAQEIGSPVTKDTGFRPGLKGPDGDVHMPSHIWFIHVLPDYVTDEDKIQAAKNFMLDLGNNYSAATYYSELYNFPTFASQVPQLYADDGWLSNDPWGSEPADKLEVLRDAEDWTVWLGYPGYANPAIGEVYQTHVLTTMMANAARGAATPEEAVANAAAEIEKIFEKWRERGFVGGGEQE
ncbi:MAG TPA: extracellular solute-binding protein [Salinisphaeraceae bacterium]|nr:extracellular solute-binding protein [Salinisphaeraceae bacterium]